MANLYVTYIADGLPRSVEQGAGTQDLYNMQAMARSLSDNYRPALGAGDRSSFEGPPDSCAGSNGASLFGSLQSDSPVVSSPFNAVRPVMATASISCLPTGSPRSH